MKFSLDIKEVDYFDDDTSKCYNEMKLETDEWVLIESGFKSWFNKVFVFDFPDGQTKFDDIMMDYGFKNCTKKLIRVKYNGECEIYDHVKLSSKDIALIHRATSGTIYHDKCWDYSLTFSD